VNLNDITGSDRHVIWIDCEMTGLRINADTTEQPDDELIEIGVIVTDGFLNPVDSGMTVVIKPSAGALEHMNSFVRSMHTSSGLLAALTDGATLADAESAVLEYITQHVPTPKTAQVGGNTIMMDRMFIAKYMPTMRPFQSSSWLVAGAQCLNTIGTTPRATGLRLHCFLMPISPCSCCTPHKPTW
jgi:oligoribonuclease (3'-5' exoribonuclease)